jgi:hypothetical protein
MRASRAETLAKTLPFTLAFVGSTLGSMAVVYIISSTGRMVYRLLV